ncbi:formate/nitrite transporter family protein [Hymenobacter sp. RP-2-7]|uniref:Formate/nitrite transporter family protein n=1 Tax=Hymenobacter polaris TaxID=2682546 RepID=A0A7Y0FKQ4_9BACT|nr:formate/nitrite transporter family protein [Hymenobacter polaris]NML63795.1 formate/nitrite transporter family protein [Hymenobacter polaris]
MPDQASEKQDSQEAQERSAPSGKVIYRAILAEGQEELERPSAALFWSGLAAGLSMGFSMIAEGLLERYLPEAPWRPLVANLGYSVGFLIVILGRQQLFTENTLTPILPLLQQPTWACLRNVGRLWGIVLFTNLVGAFLLSLVVVHSTVFEAEAKAAFVHMGKLALAPGFGTVLLRGIFAGWLIALMVWLLPFAEEGRIWVIIFLTYVVGVGHFSHVIAGSVEVFTLAAAGKTTWAAALGGFTVPALLGNILGGVSLVAALNHAQVTAGQDEGNEQ